GPGAPRAARTLPDARAAPSRDAAPPSSRAPPGTCPIRPNAPRSARRAGTAETLGAKPMRAALFVHVDEPLSVEDVTPLDPGPHDVVVRLAASGVCHSDLSMADGTVRLRGATVLGHEGSGVVD